MAIGWFRSGGCIFCCICFCGVGVTFGNSFSDGVAKAIGEMVRLESTVVLRRQKVRKLGCFRRRRSERELGRDLSADDWLRRFITLGDDCVLIASSRQSTSKDTPRNYRGPGNSQSLFALYIKIFLIFSVRCHSIAVLPRTISYTAIAGLREP